jgi:Glycosyltransferase family 87
MSLPRLRPRTLRQLQFVAYAAAVLGALMGIGTLHLHLTMDPLADINAYYDAARRLNAGLPLYEHGSSMEYFYPPLLATVLRPFAQLPFPVFAALWEALILASFVATLWLIGVRRRATWLAVGMLGVPIAWTLTIGQAQALLTLFVALGTPLGVALAAQLKLFPALIALYWIGRRDWRALGSFLAISAALVLFQAITEPRGLMDFLSVSGLQRVGEVRNISPYVISPVLWAVLVVVGAVTVLVVARSRWGWPAAVVYSTVASPRLLVYMLEALLAALARPRREQHRVVEARDHVPGGPPEQGSRLPDRLPPDA